MDVEVNRCVGEWAGWRRGACMDRWVSKRLDGCVGERVDGHLGRNEWAMNEGL